MLFDRLLVYDDRSRSGAAFNMALDEALLEQSAAPVVRFYGWAGPSLSFGYFGKFTEVAAAGGARELVRRWTGGGTVLHGEDLTYSLITPQAHSLFSRGPTAVYAALHGAIRDALLAEGRAAQLAARDSVKVSSACFANPVRNDVLLHGCKVAGAAQRRTRKGFLHQGSIQVPDLAADFRQRLASALSPAVEWREVPPEALQRAEQLALEKYGREEWLQRW